MKQNYNILASYVQRNNKIGQCTDLDMRRLAYIREQLSKIHGLRFREVRRGNRQYAQYLEARVVYTDHIYVQIYLTVLLPRKSENPVNHLILDFDDLDSEEYAQSNGLDDYLADQIKLALVDFPMQ